MINEQITDYCLSKPGGYEDFPFGEIPVCYKVCGRLFLQLYPLPDDHKITVSCEPMLADFYRSQYSGVVTAGYHCRFLPFTIFRCCHSGLPLPRTSQAVYEYRIS
jgi:predicted DNA-binding protein (MmcQ/YjbR family)